jgi:nucleoside-diphosphate-sugar epimerase
MRVVIAGAHGQIAMRLTSRLRERGDAVVGLIRNPAHTGEVRTLGAEPVLCDIENATVTEIAEALEGADAAVFAAGAGPGSGAERKLTVDRDGAIKLLQACVSAEVSRYVIVSSIGAEDPPAGDEVFSVYLRAKAEADAAVIESDREWTILRPGGLTDDRGTARVRLDTKPFEGRISRDDVAAVLDALLQTDRAAGLILYINGGELSVQEALEPYLK